MREELAAAVERAYGVFARYTLGDSLEVCRCNVCMCEPEIERVLVTTPLRELGAAWLAEYTNSAHGYGEGRIADELRHFLPRYLELVALDDPPSHLGLVFCLSRLGEAEWRSRWPPAEADAIASFFAALFAERLRDVRIESFRSGEYLALARDIAEVLSFVAAAGGDLRPLLRLWDESPEPAASLHIAQFAESAADRPSTGILASDVLAGHAVDQPGYVAAWLARPELRRRLETAHDAADQLARARPAHAEPAHAAILRRGLESIDGALATFERATHRRRALGGVRAPD